jgi:Family of unknown function (DUF5522)
MRDPLADRPLTEPHPSRLASSDPDFDAILAAHETALSRGDIGYADPRSGLFVLTAGYLASKGSCCDSGCRHCPYVT